MRIIFRDTSKSQGTSIYTFNDENLTTQILFDKYDLDKDLIYLISNGKILKETEPLCEYNNMIIETRIRLRGGKGGFGINLKNQQAVKKQTKNFDACRDLQGRRLRKVNQERQLNEWRIKKVEEEKLLQKYIEGHNNSEEDLFKKIINEKKQSDVYRKNKKFFEDNENLKNNIQNSFKYFINKKRKNGNTKKEENQKLIEDDKITEKNKPNELMENQDKKEQNLELEEIKKMDNENDLLNMILF